MSDLLIKKGNKKIIKIFDCMGNGYCNHFDLKIINEIIDKIGLSSGATVLEAGAGHGDFTPFLLEKINDDGKIIFCDISSVMIKEAQKKINDNRVNFNESDVCTINLSDNSLDFVVCFNSFPHFLDQRGFIDNCFRILKKDGQLIICHDQSRAEVVKIHQRKNIDSSLSCFPNELEIKQLLKDGGFVPNDFMDNNYYFIGATRIEV